MSRLRAVVHASRQHLYRQTSYSQSGEDLIVAYYLMKVLHITKPTYVDVGTHHPVFFNNTYLLYKGGSRGVCVEPDPRLYRTIRRTRRRDVCLNAGIGINNGESSADFYVMSSRTLSTFSYAAASQYEAYGHRIESVLLVPVLTLEKIFECYFEGRTPDFVSIDAEGLDLEILRSIDFGRHRPRVICVETATYRGEGNIGVKEQPIIDFMRSRNYAVYGDTFINTIFIDVRS